MKKYDLIVIGGGFAGTAAAISAARQGLNVLLVDKGNALGGTAVNCLVTPFMPYWTTENGEQYNLSEGLFAEIRAELEKINPRAICDIKFNEEYLKIVLNRMAVKAGVELLFHAVLSDVTTDGKKICSVEIVTKSGKLNLTADYFIDASGDADLER